MYNYGRKAETVTLLKTFVVVTKHGIDHMIAGILFGTRFFTNLHSYNMRT